jgi:uncharacterized protein
MAPAALIDTSVIIALVNASDSRYQECLTALASVRIPLLTTEAVLTEFFYLIQSRSLNLNAAWRFVRSGAITVRPMGDSELPMLHALMAQYADRPMDFADATLVLLAQQDRIGTILTLDRNDFETYRISHGKKFTILPGGVSLSSRV